MDESGTDQSHQTIQSARASGSCLIAASLFMKSRRPSATDIEPTSKCILCRANNQLHLLKLASHFAQSQEQFQSGALCYLPTNTADPSRCAYASLAQASCMGNWAFHLDQASRLRHDNGSFVPTWADSFWDVQPDRAFIQLERVATTFSPSRTTVASMYGVHNECCPALKAPEFQYRNRGSGLGAPHYCGLGFCATK